jgi:Outer membrane efflux protein
MRTQVLELLKPVIVPPPRLVARGSQNPPARGGAGQPAPVQGQPAPGQNPPAASPSNILDREIVNEPQPLSPAQVGEVGRMTPQEAGELAKVLVPPIELQSDTEAYGYPKGSRVYKISMQQAWVLALMNARFYQFNLENVYLAALPVTLQRFTFEPQFYAGLGSATAVPQTQGTVAGVGLPSTPGVVTGSGANFTYATRFAPNGQISALNLGTVAGFGKLFSTGGQLLMGFANEVAFNFLNKNPGQPTVISALPISFVQPLLRGGGRAVVLEPLTQQERNLLYAIRTFALFRQQFFVVTMTGGTIQNFGNTFNLAGFSAPGNSDPTTGFIPVVFNLVEVEVDRRNLFFLESLAKLYQELIQGEASGLSRLQVDQVMQSLISGRQQLFQDKITYRTSLDTFRMQLSLPPDTPIIVDMSLAQPFYDVFDAVDRWQRRSDRDLKELPGIIAKIPELEDIDVEGRSVLEPYRNYRSTLQEFNPENEEGLEDLLESAVRIALEYRMDLMNNRAQLYDAWRQIRFFANALKGVLNLTLSNNIYTPVTSSTNPFAFLSQAKQFSLAFNAELPLVRVAERNNFRSALISYQRTRRSLQTAEDNLKIQLRNDLRSVHLTYINYEIAKRNYELNVRLKDQSFEQIVAPPAGGTQALAQSANAATQTTNLLNFQGRLIMAMLALTNGWQAFETARLIVYRDIGILPYDEWEAFSELFPSQYHGPIIGQAPAGGTGFTPPAEASAPAPERR